MKVEFLKDLGITEKSIIDAIMAENGKDIDKVRHDKDAANTEINGLKKQLAERDSQLNELKKSVGDNEALTAKIAELENINKTVKADYENQLESLRKDNEIESKLRDAKAKNIKAAKALLNPNDDLDKQIKFLKEQEDTKFLFEGETKIQVPAGTTPASGITVTTKELTFAERIGNALKG